MIHLFVLQSGGSDIGSLLSNYGLLMLMLVVVWFFFLRPQAKKQKAQAKFTDNITKGDQVVTSSGILGKVNKVEDNIVTLEIANKTFIRILKSSISREMTETINKESDG